MELKTGSIVKYLGTEYKISGTHPSKIDGKMRVLLIDKNVSFLEMEKAKGTFVNAEEIDGYEPANGANHPISATQDHSSTPYMDHSAGDSEPIVGLGGICLRRNRHECFEGSRLPFWAFLRKALESIWRFHHCGICNEIRSCS